MDSAKPYAKIKLGAWTDHVICSASAQHTTLFYLFDDSGKDREYIPSLLTEPKDISRQKMKVGENT